MLTPGPQASLPPGSHTIMTSKSAARIFQPVVLRSSAFSRACRPPSSSAGPLQPSAIPTPAEHTSLSCFGAGDSASPCLASPSRGALAAVSGRAPCFHATHDMAHSGPGAVAGAAAGAGAAASPLHWMAVLQTKTRNGLSPAGQDVSARAYSPSHTPRTVSALLDHPRLEFEFVGKGAKEAAWRERVLGNACALQGVSSRASRAPVCQLCSSSFSPSSPSRSQSHSNRLHAAPVMHLLKTPLGPWPGTSSGSAAGPLGDVRLQSPGLAYCIAAESASAEQAAATAAAAEATGSGLKLLSGACALPHPDKVEKGGEDAFFISTANCAVGVADGVGGWADVGVDAGAYARELMTEAVKAVEGEFRGLADPLAVLNTAHANTKSQGSSTACVILLKDQKLAAANLGDSGFMLIRSGRTIFKSPPQQHDFNFPFQLGSTGGDSPSNAEVYSLPVVPGDVIVVGTDGLFDNVFDPEVASMVMHSLLAGRSPQNTADHIAALARLRAADRVRLSPFARAAMEAGYRYYGGKMDDITVVVSYVTSTTSTAASPSPSPSPSSGNMSSSSTYSSPNRSSTTGAAPASSAPISSSNSSSSI